MVEVYVSYLRKKLDVHGPPLIRTVRGIGYCLRVPSASHRPDPPVGAGADDPPSPPPAAVGRDRGRRSGHLGRGHLQRPPLVPGHPGGPAARRRPPSRWAGRCSRRRVWDPRCPPRPPVGIPPAAAHAGAGPSRGGFRNGGGFFGQPGNAARGVLVPPGPTACSGAPPARSRPTCSSTTAGRPRPRRAIPASLPGSGLPAGTDLYFTTSSTGAGAVAYRALAKPLAGDSGVIVVAVPLTDLESTLRQLLSSNWSSRPWCSSGWASLSWVMVRRDLRPLEEITETAGRHRPGRPVPTGVPGGRGHRGRPAGQGLQHHDRRDRGGVRRAGRVRGPAPALPGRRLPRAAHPVDLDPRLRRALRPRGAGPAGRAGPVAPPHQGRGVRMGTLVDDLFLLAQLDHERPLRIEPVDLADLVRRSVAGIRGVGPRPPGRRRRRRDGWWSTATRTGSARWWTTSWSTPSSTRRPAPPSGSR